MLGFRIQSTVFFYFKFLGNYRTHDTRTLTVAMSCQEVGTSSMLTTSGQRSILLLRCIQSLCKYRQEASFFTKIRLLHFRSAK